MAAVKFAKAFHRHTICPDATVPGATVREVLDAYLALYPSARGYALDEHGAVRKHVTVFVDGEQVADRTGLLAMRNALRKLAQGRDERFWRPAAIWDELIKTGRRFEDLNGP